MQQTHRGLPPFSSGQTWAAFLKNHMGETWAFVYFIIELGSRRIAHYGVTRSPRDFWVAQQFTVRGMSLISDSGQ